MSSGEDQDLLIYFRQHMSRFQSIKSAYIILIRNIMCLRGRPTGLPLLDSWPHSGAIEIHNFSIRYGEKFAVKNVTLSIRGGEKVAIVGRTGSGSCFVSSTLRFNVDPFYRFADSDIWLALEACQLKEMVSKRDHGLMAVIEEGGKNMKVVREHFRHATTITIAHNLEAIGECDSTKENSSIHEPCT
ncbi:hypothetical protein OSTOST_21244, partial [Ostertagia ostertagi]